MPLLYAFQDLAGDWHGHPDDHIDWDKPAVAKLTIIDERSPYIGQTLTVWSAAMEGSSPPGSYVTLDHGRRLCMTVAVENEIYPWTEGERQPRQREYAGIVEPWRGASYEAPDDEN